MAQVTQPDALCTYLGSTAGPKEVATLGGCQHARSHDNSRTTQKSLISQPIFELAAGPTLGLCTHAPKPRTPRRHRLTCHGPKARSEALREATAEGCWGRRSLEWKGAWRSRRMRKSEILGERRSLPDAQSKSEREYFLLRFYVQPLSCSGGGCCMHIDLLSPVSLPPAAQNPYLKVR